MCNKSAPLCRVGTAVLAGLMPVLAGCNIFRGIVLLWGQEPTRKIPAEYAELPGKKLCVLVWAEPYTLFEYQHVQFELAEFVRAGIEGKVAGASFVPNRQVDDFVRSHPDWELQPPAGIGARLGADRVLLLELTEYSTREPDSPHLYRGHISANVKVYDTAVPDSEPIYKTTIETVHPPETFAAYGTTDRMVRQATMQAFAAQLTNKFYERQEKAR